MKKKKTFDMLNGSIWNKLILFALPLAASNPIIENIVCHFPEPDSPTIPNVSPL